MKKWSLTFYCLLCLIASCFAQVQWDSEKMCAKMDSVLEIPGVSKDDLYNRAKIWMASNFKSSDNQVLMDDQNKENIIGSGNILLKDKYVLATHYKERVLNFKFSIYFKEGKVKYVIDKIIMSEMYQTSKGYDSYVTDFNTKYEKLAEKKNAKRKDFQDELDNTFLSLIKDLENSLKSNSPAKSEDW